MKKRLKPFRFLSLTFLSLLIIFSLFIFSPPAPFAHGTGKIVQIKSGMTLRQIGALLEDNGIIRSRKAFVLIAKLTSIEKKIHSGAYALSPSMSLFHVLASLEKGDSIRICFTVPECSDVKKISEILKKSGFKTGDDFVRLAESPLLASKFGINSPTLEGYLFPETYCAGPDASSEELISMMVGQFRKKTGAAEEKKAAELGLSLHKILTIASIIEKETSTPNDMPLVSSVIHNRLKAGMPVQSVVTVIYALGPLYKGIIGKKEVEFESPYNTYLHTGLPPAPICNPGLASVKAALNPTVTDYLYFVSDTTGKTTFSATLDEHTEAKINSMTAP